MKNSMAYRTFFFMPEWSVKYPSTGRGSVSKINASMVLQVIKHLWHSVTRQIDG
ncbi:hypothetical protein SAMN05192548_107914 [Paraburkholderia terricola]|uniref:Uncharacterized protein n=1 Tax=Paraburkholderia terricola TaxID=169427 RepID=A0A1M6YVU1_9BURK|nr:hypothetical protein SAMN05192547_107815 [Paraburkholderia sediminicola]SHL22192.1 hypothetical protein SAMN05192548_107914 [Paraburkholderia terricola]